MEASIMENNNSQHTNIRGDNIKAEVVFGTIANKGQIEHQNNDVGVGVSNAKIKTNKLAGNINEAPEKTLAETAAEIQQLLQQLEQSNPTRTTVGKTKVATQVIESIESDFALKQRVIGALKSSGTEALKEAINHPVANILVASFQDWIKR